MQSIFQYRRLRRDLEAQLKSSHAGNYSHGQDDRTSGALRTDHNIDLEKNVHRNDSHPRTPSSPRNQPAHPSPSSEKPPSASSDGKGDSSDTQPEPIDDTVPDDDNEDDYDEDDQDDDEIPEADSQRTVSRTSTRHSQRTRLGNALTGVEVRKRTTHEGGEGDVFVVNYHGDDDPNDPHNWSFAKRMSTTMLIGSIASLVGLSSAIDSVALIPAAEEFHVAQVVEAGATGLFLMGFGVGSLFAGETVGRNPVYIATLILFMIFVMASGLSPNIGAQLAFRFLAGVFGATPLTCAGGSISDLWTPLERVYAFPIFAEAGFNGPLLGPIIGGYMVQYLDWRWTEWITLIISGTILVLVILFQPETYPQIILKWKAEHLRKLTGDDRYKAQIEIRATTFAQRLRTALWRPFLLFVQEPIIICIALYLTVVYIVLFTFLDGYNFIFTDTYGISPGLTGICFVGLSIGILSVLLLVPLIYRWAKRDLAKIIANGGTQLPPEFRLWWSMLGGSFFIPIGLFWMGWTANPHISIWSPLLASVMVGHGFLCVFLTSYQYLIDAYETYAASALAAMTMIRYVASGAMTIVGIPFYRNLGVHYTITILACLTVPLVPLPYVLFKYGPWIRSKSKYASNATTG